MEYERLKRINAIKVQLIWKLDDTWSKNLKRLKDKNKN